MNNSASKGYSSVHGLWSVENLAELADGPNGFGEVARGWCYLPGRSV
jgi:hypothetical protein